MCKEAISYWGCGRVGGIAFIRIMLLLSDCNPPYRCVDVGSWVLHLHKVNRRLEFGILPQLAKEVVEKDAVVDCKFGAG